MKAFKNHIEKYHSYNGKGDGSLHEENGYWFRVTEDFYNYITNLIDLLEQETVPYFSDNCSLCYYIKSTIKL